MSIIAGVDNPVSIPRKAPKAQPEAKTTEAKKATTTKSTKK